MRRRPLAVLVVALCLACSPSDERPAPVATDADARPRDGGTLVRRLDSDIITVNPVLASSRYDRFVANYIFTPLIRIDRDLQPIAGLAKTWEISDDGLLYRFELNENATFSDGSPVRASDVVFTLQKIVDPASEAVQIAAGFEHLDPARTRATGEKTVEVGFRRAIATQLMRFNDLLVVPQHIYSKGDFRTDFAARAIGSGPYRLVRRETGREIVLERRDDYWDTRPHIKSVIFRVIGEHTTAWNALKRGDVDETLLTSDTWLRARNDASLNQAIDFHRFYTRQYNFIAWNTRDPLLNDSRIRRALAMCVPLERVVNDLYHGTARAMTGPFTPDEWAFNPSVAAIRHDPEEARRVFASDGWSDRDHDGLLEKNGKPFELQLTIMSGSSTAKQFAQMVQAELKKAGIRLEVAVLDGATAVQHILAGNYQAAYLAWDLDPDPDPFALFHSSQFPPRGQNVVYYANPEADALIEEGRREFDRSKRKATYWRLHERLAEDQPYTWTTQVSTKWGARKRLRGVEISRGFGLFLWYPGELAWWLARDSETPEPAGR